MLSIHHAGVRKKFVAYPAQMHERLLILRQLILETAGELADVGIVEETLKWGEPSYVTKGGSPIRIDWKPAKSEQYAMFFNCQTMLVSTFKALYSDDFTFEGNRAIVFHKNDDIEIDALKHCISLALRYHKVKHLPSLGA